MARTQPGITLPEDLWKKAKKHYGSRETSEAIENLIREDLPNTERKKSVKIGDVSNLTAPRKQLLQRLIEIGNFPYSKVRITKIAELNGIYTSSKYVKKAVDVFNKNHQIPFTMSDGRLDWKEVKCDCGAKVYPNASDECPNCGADFELGLD